MDAIYQKASPSGSRGVPKMFLLMTYDLEILLSGISCLHNDKANGEDVNLSHSYYFYLPRQSIVNVTT